MRALTLNVGSTALPRAEKIVSWLSVCDEDVIILTETSKGPGSRLLIDSLTDWGYHVVASHDDRDRGVATATRLPIAAPLELPVTLPWRCAGFVLDTRPKVTVIGVYIPSRDRTPEKTLRKEQFIASLLTGLRAMPAADRAGVLLGGDYNTVARSHTPRLAGLRPFEYDMHDDLSDLSLVAAHELAGVLEQPHSWMGRTGIGYLYDYFHLGDCLHDALTGCQYVHEPRLLGLSDHAAVHVTLDVAVNASPAR